MAEGVELATAWVRLVFSAKDAQGQVAESLAPVSKTAEEEGKKSGSKFSAGMKTTLALGAAAAAAGIVTVFKTGLEELKFGEQINAQTQVLLDNTGFAMSVGQINDYTLALSKVSGVSEEDLQAAGNNILKFGNVSEENYQKALDSINDLAATGKDAASVSEGLGKALADPATAAGKLRRMGISLTEQQEAQIATMVEAGDVAGAQSVILDSLESTYGGMAEAAGGTLEGNINKLNNAFENLSGDLVEAVMPAVEGLVTGLGGLIDWVSANQWVIPVLATAIGVLLVGAFIAWTATIWAATAALLANPITWVVIAVVALMAAIVLLAMNWEHVAAWITDVWGGFIGWMTGVIDGFVGWWNGVWAGVAAWFEQLWAGIVLAVQLYILMVQTIIRTIVTAIAAVWNGIWSGIASFFMGIWNGIVNAVRSFGSFFRSAFDGIAGFVRAAFNAVLGAVKGPINAIISLVNQAIGGLNRLRVTIPAWVPGVGGQTFGLNLPRIPMLAEGGTILRGGSVLVGERGPEILRLPAGAVVDPDIASADTEAGAGFVNKGTIITQNVDEFWAVAEKRKRRALNTAGLVSRVGVS